VVERTSRFLVLVPLHGRDALTVGRAVIAATAGLPERMRASLTWDCGAEMAAHAAVTKGSMPVYFAHPHSPWERGSNENLNRMGSLDGKVAFSGAAARRGGSPPPSTRWPRCWGSWPRSRLERLDIAVAVPPDNDAPSASHASPRPSCDPTVRGS
jgi:hypothetical protein